jgi:hypothetical protein
MPPIRDDLDFFSDLFNFNRLTISNLLYLVEFFFITFQKV